MIFLILIIFKLFLLLNVLNYISNKIEIIVLVNSLNFKKFQISGIEKMVLK